MPTKCGLPVYKNFGGERYTLWGMKNATGTPKSIAEKDADFQRRYNNYKVRIVECKGRFFLYMKWKGPRGD